jgi:hypothetical protein
MKYAEVLNEHNFTQEAIKGFQPGLKKLVKGEKLAELSELEAYHHNVFVSLSCILSSFNRLYLTGIYLKHFIKSDVLDKHGISQADCIQYHYSNHVTILVGIDDQALILTNYTFRLGLSERKCNKDTVIKNALVISTGVDEILKQIQEVAEPRRYCRNLYVHRGFARKNENVSFLAAYEYAMQNMSDDYDNLKYILEPYEELVVDDIERELSKQEKQMFTYVEELLTKLLKVYKAMDEELTYRELKDISKGIK